MKRMLFLYLLFSLFGCSEPIKNNLFESIEEKCRQGNEEIVFMNLTDFEWDEVFIFPDGISRVEVEKVLGLTVGGSSEFVNRIIFLKKDKVVNYSENENLPSESNENSIHFEYSDDQREFLRFTPETGRFKVLLDEIDDVKYFTLIPLN